MDEQDDDAEHRCASYLLLILRDAIEVLSASEVDLVVDDDGGGVEAVVELVKGQEAVDSRHDSSTEAPAT